MRHILTALAVVACAVLTAGAADDEKYTSKEGKYAVVFPTGEPVKTDTTKSSDIDIHIATVKTADKTYIVTYMDLPATAVREVPAKTFFDGGQKTAVANTGAKIDSTKDFAFGKEKYPAREVVADKDGNKIRSQLILAGTRLYFLTVAGPKDFATGKDATAFFESFEITK
jgi:hypothetical protein